MGVLYDLGCMGCGYSEERVLTYEECQTSFKCPNCDEETLKVVWLTPPTYGQLGKEGSEKSIKAMKQSLRSDESRKRRRARGRGTEGE